ncbi:MAG: hypothetical protein ACYDD7_24950, partial [Acidimicrobiales bacterium]
MSLTSELDDHNSPISRFMARYFPQVKELQEPWRRRMAKLDTLRPAQAPPWSTNGVALTYRLGFALGEMPLMVGLLGMDSWCQGTKSRTASTARQKVRTDLLAHIKALLEAHQPAGGGPVGAEACEDLCRASYVLALFEELARAGTRIKTALWDLPAKPTLSGLLALAPDHAVADLCVLTNAAHGPLIGEFEAVSTDRRHL